MKALRLLALAAFLLAAGPAGAMTLVFSDPDGLDKGHVCEVGSSTCDAVTPDFLTGAAVSIFGATTGTVDIVGSPFGVAEVTLFVDEFSYVDTSGGFDGVEEIVFTDVTWSVSGWSVYDNGSFVFSIAPGSGTVSGTYEQLDGGGSTLVGPTAFGAIPADFTALNCTVGTGSETCGIAADFVLDLGPTTPTAHEFKQTFNLSAPEPGTGLLLGFGLLGLALRRRRS